MHACTVTVRQGAGKMPVRATKEHPHVDELKRPGGRFSPVHLNKTFELMYTVQSLNQCFILHVQCQILEHHLKMSYSVCHYYDFVFSEFI